LERTRSSLLGLALSFIYIFVVVPVAWRRRSQRESAIGLWNVPHARDGWRVNEQSTINPEIYRNLLSMRDELVTIEREKGDRWMVFLYDLLVAMRFLAKPPKEKEVRPDLYAMF
jgi:hypothetical protein